MRRLMVPAAPVRADDGRQSARLRRHCLAIPGAIEKISHGEPTFFTPKRVFAMFANNHHGDGHVAVWLPYVGPSGWVGVELSRVADDQLGALVREAFNRIGARNPPRGARKTEVRRAVKTTRAKAAHKVPR